METVVAPDDFTYLLADGNEAFFTPLTHGFNYPVLEVEVADLEAGELRYPEPGIEEGEDDSIVPESLAGGGIDGYEQCPDLVRGEGRHYLARCLGHLYPVEGVIFSDLFGYQPRPEGAD